MSMTSPAILSNFFEEQWTQNHPQYLSGLSRALFSTTFLEVAVYAKVVRRGPTVYLSYPRFKSEIKIRRLIFSPLVSLQSTACRTAFSRGSPTKLSSRKASEWHEASTCAVSSGISVTAHTSSSSLRIKGIMLKIHQHNYNNTQIIVALLSSKRSIFNKKRLIILRPLKR